MSIKIEERPGEQLVYAVVGGTFEEFEIRKVTYEHTPNDSYHFFVDEFEVTREVYLAALETSRANRLVLSDDDDGGPVEPVPVDAGSVH